MKRMIAILLAALTMTAVLAGCGRSRDGNSGNVSTTPNGRVNGGDNAIVDNNTGVDSFGNADSNRDTSANNGGANSSNGSNANNGYTDGTGDARTDSNTQDRGDSTGSAMDDMREAADDMGQAAKDAGRAMGDAITGNTGTGMTGER